MNKVKQFFNRNRTQQYSEVLLDNIFMWYFHDMCMSMTTPIKIIIIDTFYFASIQSGFECYMTNVLLSRMENHIFRFGDIYREAIYY